MLRIIYSGSDQTLILKKEKKIVLVKSLHPKVLHPHVDAGLLGGVPVGCRVLGLDQTQHQGDQPDPCQGVGSVSGWILSCFWVGSDPTQYLGNMYVGEMVRNMSFF